MGNAKLNIVRYSPEVYRITRRFEVPEGTFGYASYIVEDRNGMALIKADGQPQRFRFNELI